ncbi:1,4-dihydroxy-2-naphthoate polyprenyltransferase [Actinobacillus succinogenes]|uniref:1,4-dihydroxy-2-naphthoate octaprenyltransferase n=1 Tax=Actinobacillus succinogenes (strain ATCC 55618 / DSM 22257 / CCUG 43843 / 130Z) TaxID=339671 RepID=A6VLP3_ACTSZ|nr:1,4-dihydroxy-2-naphthoate polyprenyltransferase [Actinobacillus succinogenes]ABR73890.1 1,4-dihydroxy-2-naphthoate octaprenyltransferase [Actinobacillus succinogenes 130Z]PHI39659.1 1,4-dihydroxy-2-naphthoate polyprenyltransferase [Actinobacillus succinogenes]
MAKTSFKAWLDTARPKTLPLALAIILTGSALSQWRGSFSWSVTLLCLLTATLLQIVSNFANDYGDYQKGSDTAERIGPLRGIQQGEMTAAQLRKGLIVAITISFVSGVLLIAIAYEDIKDLIVFGGLGLLAILAAITYTVGKKPYGYLGLGDISVFLFFGLLSVCGTYYLQTHELSGDIFLPASACGLLSTAVLNINNLRDIEQDKKAGKNTLIVRIGPEKGRIYHCFLLLGAVLCYALFALKYKPILLSVIGVIAFLLARHAKFVVTHKDPSALRPMLAKMSMLALISTVLFSLGLLMLP